MEPVAFNASELADTEAPNVSQPGGEGIATRHR
jgi:hypothetical protein